MKRQKIYYYIKIAAQHLNMPLIVGKLSSKFEPSEMILWAGSDFLKSVTFLIFGLDVEMITWIRICLKDGAV